MKHFEIMYILRPGTPDVNTVVGEFDKLINTNNGKVFKSDIWGEKRLAYEINNCKTGIYILTTFMAEPGCVKELDRKMRISENVIRHLIISRMEGGE